MQKQDGVVGEALAQGARAVSAANAGTSARQSDLVAFKSLPRNKIRPPTLSHALLFHICLKCVENSTHVLDTESGKSELQFPIAETVDKVLQTIWQNPLLIKFSKIPPMEIIDVNDVNNKVNKLIAMSALASTDSE